MSNEVEEVEAPQEEVAQIDVDGMSDDELDAFLEEQTGVADIGNLDVIDEEEGTPLETTPEAEVATEVEEEVEEEEEVPEEESPEEEPEVEGEEETLVEEEVASIDLSQYNDDEVTLMSEVYEDLFKNGIKASGVNRTVKDPEHLKTLVRIAFSANESNRRIKPYLRQLKSLEQAGVSLEDGNINFLVDVMNGNEDAIKELVMNKHKVNEDTLQSWIDGDEEGNGESYKATNHVISDSRFQLEEVLDGIKDSPSYNKTVRFLGTIDDDGKVLISENPELAGLLNADIENGIFDKALDEAYFRMDRGLLPKQSILQSYINVMQDEDFYASLTGTQVPTKVTAEKEVKPTQNKKEVVSRKKRASNVSTSKASTKRSSTNVQSKDIKQMSNEEFDEFYATLGIDD